jgi:Rha family phage regulatory protein
MNMKQLVEAKTDGLFCNSRMVADKFGAQHIKVVRVIERIIKKLENRKSAKLSRLNPETSIKIVRFDDEYRGKTFTAYWMDRTAFTLVAMRFETEAAFEWQIKFVEAFDALEKQLILEATNKNNVEWAEQRRQGKAIRLTTTDAIKDFIEYATGQGSQNARHYYKHVTVACYKCLNLIEAKRPKLRDTLDLIQSSFLAAAEVVAERSIRKHMAEGEHYQTIFTLVKQDLERFADGLMIPNLTGQEQITTKGAISEIK